MKRYLLSFLFLIFTLSTALAGDWIQKASFGGVGRHRASGCATANKGYMGLGHMNGSGVNINYLLRKIRWNQLAFFADL